MSKQSTNKLEKLYKQLKNTEQKFKEVRSKISLIKNNIEIEKSKDIKKVLKQYDMSINDVKNIIENFKNSTNKDDKVDAYEK